eukprot:3506817-Pleurochrysis_carterae.AAC.2
MNIKPSLQAYSGAQGNDVPCLDRAAERHRQCLQALQYPCLDKATYVQNRECPHVSASLKFYAIAKTTSVASTSIKMLAIVSNGTSVEQVAVDG